MAEIVRSSDH